MKKLKKECRHNGSYIFNAAKGCEECLIKSHQAFAEGCDCAFCSPKPSKPIEKIKTSFHFIDKEYIRKTGEFNVTLIGEIVKLENKINEIIDYLKLSH